MTRRHPDTRLPYARLVDGDRYLAPGQRAPLADLIHGGRMVAVSLPFPLRLRLIGAALLPWRHRP